MFMFFGNYSKHYIWFAHFNNYIEEMTQNKVYFLMFQHLLSQTQPIYNKIHFWFSLKQW